MLASYQIYFGTECEAQNIIFILVTKALSLSYYAYSGAESSKAGEVSIKSGSEPERRVTNGERGISGRPKVVRRSRQNPLGYIYSLYSASARFGNEGVNLSYQNKFLTVRKSVRKNISANFFSKSKNLHSKSRKQWR